MVYQAPQDIMIGGLQLEQISFYPEDESDGVMLNCKCCVGLGVLEA
jgi:hypothetical protein